VLVAVLTTGQGGASAQAGLAVLGVQYQQDNPYPEFNCIWSDKSYPTSCTARALGCNVSVFVQNPGAATVTINDVTLAGYSLRTVLKRDPNVHDANSIFFYWDNPPQAIFDAGEPVWYKADPPVLPPGGVGRVVVRLRSVPVTRPVVVGVVASDGTVTTNVAVDATAPQVASVGFSQDRTRVYVHWRRAGGAAPIAVKMDGVDVTALTTTVGDPALNFGVSVLNLSTGLTAMSYHVFQGLYADGKSASAGLRVWAHPFVHATWSTFPCPDGDMACGQAWVDNAVNHGFNAAQNQLDGAGVADYLGSSAGKAYAAAKGYGLIVWNQTTSDSPLMSFTDDEPDAEEANMESTHCGTGLRLPCGRSPMGILVLREIEKGESYRALYPLAPTTVNLNGTYKPENYYAWGQAMDVLQVDPYYQRRLQDAYWRDQQKIPLYRQATYVYAVARAVTTAAEPNPSHVILYSCEWKCSNENNCDPEYFQQIWPFPTPESKRIEAYYALAAGAKGLSYWWFKPGYPSNGLGDQDTAAARALWREMGLYGNEIKTVSHLLVISHPVDLPLTPGDRVWARALAVGTNTLMLLVVNDDYYNDFSGCHYTPVNNATVTLTRPAWMHGPLEAFEVTAAGLYGVGTATNANQVQVNLGTLTLTKMIVLTTDPALRSALQQRYEQEVHPGVCAFAPELCTNRPPTIAQQPAAQTVQVGETASFSVSATGTLPLSYQWRKNNLNLEDDGHYSGAATPVLTIRDAGANDVGSYCCVVTNACGSVTSAAATLTLVTNLPGPIILLPIPLAAGFVANETRAVTPDGRYAVGFHGAWSTSAASGFLYDVQQKILRGPIVTPDGATAAALTGAGYRRYNGQAQLVLDGWSAGWHANFMTPDGGLSWGAQRQDTGLGSAPSGPAANSLAGTDSDAFYATFRHHASNPGNPVYVGRATGAWPAVLVWDTKGIPSGIYAAMNAVSATGRAVGYRTDSAGARCNYALQWNGLGTPDNWFFNGLDGTTKGEAFSISANGRFVFGRSPKPSGGTTNYGYKAVLSAAVPAAVESISELPGFPDNAGSPNLAAPDGCTADGRYAVGMSYRGLEKAVLWDTGDPNPGRWTVVDLTAVAADQGVLGEFSRLTRAYSVGTNVAGELVIGGVGVANGQTRGFVLTLKLPVGGLAHPPTLTISGTVADGWTLSCQSLDNPNLVYRLEAATNLGPGALWTTITSAPGTGGRIRLRDLPPGETARRFYRVRVQ